MFPSRYKRKGWRSDYFSRDRCVRSSFRVRVKEVKFSFRWTDGVGVFTLPSQKDGVISYDSVLLTLWSGIPLTVSTVRCVGPIVSDLDSVHSPEFYVVDPWDTLLKFRSDSPLVISWKRCLTLLLNVVIEVPNWRETFPLEVYQTVFPM